MNASKSLPGVNALNCSKYEYLKTAFCISEQLFHKDNTCVHEPLEQICYVDRERSMISQNDEQCMEGFYARCYMKNYQTHIEDNSCVLAEVSLLEWCTCQTTSQRNETAESIQKDCTCFPHHIQPYKIFHFTENHYSSCECSNIYRKKCDFPKDRSTTHIGINCTSTDGMLQIEKNIRCNETKDIERIVQRSKTMAHKIIKTHWVPLHPLIIKKIVHRKYKGKNNTMHVVPKLQIPTKIKSEQQNPSSPKTNDSKIPSAITQSSKSEKQHTPSVQSHSSSSEEGTDVMIQNNRTRDKMEERLENDLSSVLHVLLGEANSTYFKNFDYNLTDLTVLDHLTEERIHEQKGNTARSMTRNKNDKNTVTSVMPIDFSLFQKVVKAGSKEDYSTSENYEKQQLLDLEHLPSKTTVTLYTLIPTILIISLLGLFVYKNIHKKRRYSTLQESVLPEEDLVVETTNDALNSNNCGESSNNEYDLKETTNSRKNDTKVQIHTYTNSVFFANKSKKDKESLIENDEEVE